MWLPKSRTPSEHPNSRCRLKWVVHLSQNTIGFDNHSHFKRRHCPSFQADPLQSLGGPKERLINPMRLPGARRRTSGRRRARAPTAICWRSPGSWWSVPELARTGHERTFFLLLIFCFSSLFVLLFFSPVFLFFSFCFPPPPDGLACSFPSLRRVFLMVFSFARLEILATGSACP